MKPNRGSIVLVIGILGLVMCIPLSVAAWVMGSADLKQMDAGRMDDSGRGITNAGRILGIIGTIYLTVVCGLLFAMFFVL